jgi:DNA-directed RNA polymerase subunit K/omega
MPESGLESDRNKRNNKYMDYKKYKADHLAVTRKMRDFEKGTSNTYETVSVLSKRANQIGLELKKELDEKVAEFATTGDNLEEVFENREQIEIAKFYEQLPKPTLLAIHEYLSDGIYFRKDLESPAKEI